VSAVFGSTKGLKPSQRLRLEKLALKKVPANRIVTQEIARQLTEFSAELGRQLGMLVDRKGVVRKVLVGDAKSVLIPKLDDWRVGPGRLRGIRLIHTHLKDERLSQEDLTDLALLRLDLVAVIGMDSQGFPTVVRIAHLLPQNPQGEVWQLLEPVAPSLLDLDFGAFVLSVEDEMQRSLGARKVADTRERAYLVGRTVGKSWDVEDSLTELLELAKSCELEVVGSSIQRRDAVDPRFVVGKGKLKEIVIDALQKGAGLLIFDTELSPAQVKSIADFTELKVIDRSQLILDIFAQRAKSREGKIQVELAQLKYALPRLAEKDNALSRLTGGIGGRGPGETKLEIDRRRIHSRIGFLEKETTQLAKRREIRRRLRSRKDMPVISIVGYTNAGKSTLLNSLTKSRILAEDKLFATLDPSSRRLRFPRETEVIITDTVGFLKDLPETLVAAFAATLDELADADLLLHVIDCSNPNFEAQMEAVEKLLEKLSLSDIPIMRVFNKRDLVPEETVDTICDRFDGIAVSAISSKTFGPLIKRMEDQILMALADDWAVSNEQPVAPPGVS
jgi:GTPase